MLRLSPLVVLLLAAGASGLYETSGPVPLLTQRSFSKVLDSQLPVVVEFFAPWCGHCKALAPAYSRAAEKLKGIVPFVAVDCDAEKNKPLCGQYGVQGFPTIKLFKSGKAAPSDYQGERSAKALVEAASALLTAKHIKRVGSDEEAQAFLEQEGEGAKVLLFTGKPKASPLYKSLSTRFQPKLAFAEVGPKATETAAKLGVTSHPTLVVVDADGQQHTYTGELKATSLIDYLKRFAAGTKASPKGEAKPGKEPGEEQQDQAGHKASKGPKEGKKQKGKHRAEEAASEVASLPSVVKNVTLAELQGQVLVQEGVFILAVFAGTEESCAAKQTQLNQAVHGLHGLAKAFRLQLENAEEVAAAAKQLTALDESGLSAGGEGCPTQVFLLPFADKEDGDEWKKYSGELTTKELQKALLDVFPDSFVTLIDGTTQTNFMLQDPTRVKVLLFTDKEEVPGVLRALSCNFRTYKMDFGMVPSSEEKILKQFNVPKVPHLVLAFPRPDNAEELGLGPGPQETAKHKPIAIQAYPGPMRYPHIARFLQLLSVQLNAAPQEVLEKFLGTEGGPVHVPRSAATLHELTSQEDLEEKCLEKGGICIIAALPPQQAPRPSPEAPSADSAAAEGDEGAASTPPQLSLEMAVLQRVAVQRAAAGAGSALHFLWVDAAKYRAFAAALGVPAPGEQPAVVALAPRKQRFAVMDGPLLMDTLERFVDGLLSGKVTTAPLQEVPELKEQEEQPAEQQQPDVQEEFDLAEIMQEEVAGDMGKRDELLSKEGQKKKKSAKRKGGKKKKGKKGSSKDEL